MRVASKVGNLPSKFWYVGPLGSRIIYATDGQTDGQKQRLLPLPYGGGGIIKQGHRLATPRLVFTSYHILAARIQTVACSVDVT